MVVCETTVYKYLRLNLSWDFFESYMATVSITFPNLVEQCNLAMPAESTIEQFN